MTIDSARTRRLDILRNRPLLTLMLGHLTVDMYVGLLPVFYPLLIERFTLDLKTVGLVTLAYSGMASISQPFFGWVADRFGTRFIGLALVWTATMYATIGFAPTFPILLALAAAAGIGSGCYHPLGAVNASAVIRAGERNTAMSLYVTGGTIGVALGPLIGAVLFTVFGVRGTALMFLPGISIAIWLLFEMRAISRRLPARPKTGGVSPPPVPMLLMTAVVGLMMARAWTVLGIEAYVPIWYKSLGYGPSFYGPLTTTIILASAVGTIASGSLADRFGRKTVIVASQVLSVPAILLFAQFTGPIGFLTGALFGLIAASTAPLLLLTAQQLMVGRAGVASGLILGLGFITGAIGVPVTGAIGDAFGIGNAIRLQALIVAATIAIAWFLPSEERLRALHEDTASATRHAPAPSPRAAGGNAD